MNDYRWVVARLRGYIETFRKYGGDKAAVLARNSANVIEYLVFQRDKAAKRLCECCGVCPEDKRDPWHCEIAMIGPEWDGGNDDG